VIVHSAGSRCASKASHHWRRVSKASLQSQRRSSLESVSPTNSSSCMHIARLMVTPSPECPIYVPGCLVHQSQCRGSVGGTHHIVNGAETVASERKIIGYILCYLSAIQYHYGLTLCAHAIFTHIKCKLWGHKAPSKTGSGSYLSWMRKLRGSIRNNHLD